MKIMNPNYVAPVDAPAQQLKTKLAAWFSARPNVQSITLEQLIGAFPEGVTLSPGQIHQALKDAGITVKADE